jgi:HAD superfamily hydrolase (TIGR01509 family)
MWEEKEAKFRALAETKLTRLPGLTELLLWAKTNEVRVAAVTNAPRPNAELMLRALGLSDPPAFEHVVIGTECARAKPFPDPYLEGMRLLGAKDPSRCVAFEDSPTGMAAAVASGLPAVGVTTSQSPDSLFNAGASLCVADFADDGLLQALA